MVIRKQVFIALESIAGWKYLSKRITHGMYVHIPNATRNVRYVVFFELVRADITLRVHWAGHMPEL